MKKSLIALAVASTIAAPAAFAATANVDVYGLLHFAIEDTDAAGVDLDVVSNSSRIGFKGSEDLGGGLKGIWQIEQQFDPTTANNTAFGGSGMRNTFVGLSGGFGTVLLGRYDTSYKLATTKYNVFADTIADYAANRLDSVVLITGHTRASNAIAYISPKFSGFSFSATVITSMDQLNAAGKTVDGTSLAAGYANGPLTVDLAWEDIKGGAPANRKAWKLGAGYAFGDAKIGVVYENVNHPGNANDRDSLYLSGSYTMGPVVLKAQWGQVDRKAPNSDWDAWALGVDYNLSKRTALFAVYGNGDNGVGPDVSGYNIGVRHSF